VKRRGILTTFVAVLIVATLFAFLIAFQVRLNESAIVFTFGRASAHAITEPGLNWKWPYPIQTVKRYDTRTRVFESRFQEVYTADGKTLVVWLGIGWSVRDPKRFYERVRVVTEAEKQLDGIVSSKASATIGRHNFAEFVSTDEKTLAFDTIEAEILQTVRASKEQDPESEYGVELKFVRITRLGLPEKVTEKVFERMRAERKRIADKYREEGKRIADGTRAQADQESEDLTSNAIAEATRLRSEGDAEAAKHYAVFAKNPELANFLKKLESLLRLKERNTIFLDTRSAPFDLLRPEAPVPSSGPKSPKKPAAPESKGE